VSFSRFPVTIGRGSGNDIVLADSTVSSNHAHVQYDDHGLQLFDTSRNGTWTHARTQRLLQHGVAMEAIGGQFTIAETSFRVILTTNGAVASSGARQPRGGATSPEPSTGSGVDPRIMRIVGALGILVAQLEREREAFTRLAQAIGWTSATDPEATDMPFPELLGQWLAGHIPRSALERWSARRSASHGALVDEVLGAFDALEPATIRELCEAQFCEQGRFLRMLNEPRLLWAAYVARFSALRPIGAPAACSPAAC
jgi:hypothetical protein